MTKHVIGAVIFSLIVGTSALVGSLFSDAPAATNFGTERGNYVFKKKKKRKCRKRREHREDSQDLATVRISQMEFDSNSGLLNTEFLVAGNNDSGSTVNVALHFFSNDNYGSQHVATEFVSLAPDFNVANTALITETASYRWLKNLQTRENLYVVPEVTLEANTYKVYPPVLDSSKAIPVLFRD